MTFEGLTYALNRPRVGQLGQQVTVRRNDKPGWLAVGVQLQRGGRWELALYKP